MAVNRFFQPSSGKFVSQFVPEQLPTDLLMKPLAEKQRKADLMQAEVIKLGEWEQRALPGYDTQFVKQMKSRIEDFQSSINF